MVDYSKWDNLDSDDSGDEPEAWPESKAAPWHEREVDTGPNAPEWDNAQMGNDGEPEETYYLDNLTRNIETSVIPQYCIQCGADHPDTNGVRSHAIAERHFLCIACFLPFGSREAYDEHKRVAHDKAFEMEDTRLEAMLMIMEPLQEAVEKEMAKNGDVGGQAHLGILHVALWVVLFNFGIWAPLRDPSVKALLHSMASEAAAYARTLGLDALGRDKRVEPYYLLLSPEGPLAGKMEALVEKCETIFWGILNALQAGAPWPEVSISGERGPHDPPPSQEAGHFQISAYYKKCLELHGGDISGVGVEELRGPVHTGVGILTKWAA